MGVTVDFVANILRLGLSFISSYVSDGGGIVDLTANARRFGGDDRSSFGAISCGCGGGGGGSLIGAACKINCCCWAGACVRTVYCVPPGDVHKVATCCCC
jgi:hypothetical protein